MKKTLSIFVFIIALSFLNSCYYDNAEDLYPVDICDTTNITYSGVIQSIVSNNCNQCHSAAANFGNVTLEGYTELKKYVDNGEFLSSIKHDGNTSPMPKGGDKLSDCDISKIENWINAGAPNN